MITLNNSNIDFGFEDETLGSKYSILLSQNTSNFIFKTDNVERMTIMKNGKVGIGTTEANYNLDVNGVINAKTYLINGIDISIITSNTSNYVGTTSNILIGRINDTSNYVGITNNILIGRINDTSDYIGITSNILKGRISDTSNYVGITSNILIGRINDTSNYVGITSNILIGRISDTSNYIGTTSNIFVNLISSSLYSPLFGNIWTTLNNKVYYNTSHVGIGTNNPISKLHIYDDINATTTYKYDDINATTLTIQNNYINVSSLSSDIIQGGPTPTTIQGSTDKCIIFSYSPSSYNFYTNSNLLCDILLVGGGGSGGSSSRDGGGGGSGGGGGGGGYVYLENIILPIGSYAVTVGKGGVLGNGGISSIKGAINYIAAGGAVGSIGGLGVFGNAIDKKGYFGGSGGGGGVGNRYSYGGHSIQLQKYGYGNGGNGNNSYSNNQLWVAGGGGGAGGFIDNKINGNLNNTIFSGNGVNGLSNSITGTPITYAGGGGGGSMLFGLISNTGGAGGGGNGGYVSLEFPNQSFLPINGTDGLGGGGGGGADLQNGANGGNGIVIIRYKNIISTSSHLKLKYGKSFDANTYNYNEYNVDYNIGNYNSIFKIISLDNGVNSERLVITPAGNVGIGTTNPQCILDVYANTNSYYFTGNIYMIGYPGNIWFDFLTTIESWDENIMPPTEIPHDTLCARFTGCIWITGNCFGTCDIRIKEDIQDMNGDCALQSILAIELKKYKYIDKIVKGNSKVYGFIAQQVQKVIPEAINLENSYIPDIMMLADYYNDIITLPYKPSNVIVKIKDKIKCYDSKNNSIEIEILEIINELTFKIKDLDKKYLNNKIFVYGTYVDDFHILSKEYIFSLNVGATQELHRQIKKQDLLIKSRERINALEHKNNDLNKKYESLLKELTLIKQRFNS